MGRIVVLFLVDNLCGCASLMKPTKVIVQSCRPVLEKQMDFPAGTMAISNDWVCEK